MLYKAAHIIRAHIPWLWVWLNAVNSTLFALRFAKRLRQIPSIIKQHSCAHRTIEPLSASNIDAATRMFESQPESCYEHFRPHAFDRTTLLRLSRDKAFMAFIVVDGDEAIGYFFLRGSFTGKCFRGYMTDIGHRRMGINRIMGQCSTSIAQALGIPMYGSISPQNIASMESAKAVNDIKIISTLDNGDYYVEYLPKQQS